MAQEPYEGCLVLSLGLPGGRTRPSGRRSRLCGAGLRREALSPRPEARERRTRGSVVQGVRREALEGTKPKGASSLARRKHLTSDQGLSEGLKPGSRDQPVRPDALRRVVGSTVGKTAGGFTTRRNGFGYLPRGESFEGCQKSQERCRHETRPARCRGAKTVRRVAKP
jgi:hypothetical protein